MGCFVSRKFALALALLVAVVDVGATLAEETAAPDPLFARVNGEPLRLAEYYNAVISAGRNRFYHGRAPEAEMNSFRVQVGKEVVDNRLKLQEARRRGVAFDADAVERKYARAMARVHETDRWEELSPEEQQKVEQEIRQKFEDESTVARLEEQVREVAKPTVAEVRDYYRAHPELFTSPEQIKVSTILLKVDPWVGPAVWQEAEDRVTEIAKSIAGGADFAEMARLNSNDSSAEKGGDLGYQHKGMLGSIAQTAIDELTVGEISGPVHLLEGVALFRLDDRIEPTLNPFESVQTRAEELLLRERRQQAEVAFIEALRADAKVEYLDQDYLKLKAEVEAGSAGDDAPANASDDS